MTRKEELQQELDAIQRKEVEAKLKDLNNLEGSVDSQLKLADAKGANFIMKGDFWIKLLIGAGVTFAFLFTVWKGTMVSVQEGVTGGSESSSLFNLLSVVGPLFGIVLQYYFGTKKKSSNGE